MALIEGRHNDLERLCGPTRRYSGLSHMLDRVGGKKEAEERRKALFSAVTTYWSPYLFFPSSKPKMEPAPYLYALRPSSKGGFRLTSLLLAIVAPAPILYCIWSTDGTCGSRGLEPMGEPMLDPDTCTSSCLFFGQPKRGLDHGSRANCRRRTSNNTSFSWFAIRRPSLLHMKTTGPVNPRSDGNNGLINGPPKRVRPQDSFQNRSSRTKPRQQLRLHRASRHLPSGS